MFFGVYGKKGQANGIWNVTAGTGKFSRMMQSGEWNMVMLFPMPAGATGAQFYWWGSTKRR